MNQLQLILARIRKPSVFASLTSQIVTLLMIFKIDVDLTMVTGIVTSITSILVILGIISNPDARNRGYKDDFALCSGCNKNTQHITIGEDSICTKCGAVSTTNSK